MWWPDMPSGGEEGEITPIVVINFPSEGAKVRRVMVDVTVVQSSRVRLLPWHHRARNDRTRRTGLHVKPLKLNELRRIVSDYLGYLHLMAYRHPSQKRMHQHKVKQGIEA
jgi:hypothetical protein